MGGEENSNRTVMASSIQEKFAKKSGLMLLEQHFQASSKVMGWMDLK
jgi:hypothetical protein